MEVRAGAIVPDLDLRWPRRGGRKSCAKGPWRLSPASRCDQRWGRGLAEQLVEGTAARLPAWTAWGQEKVPFASWPRCRMWEGSWPACMALGRRKSSDLGEEVQVRGLAGPGGPWGWRRQKQCSPSLPPNFSRTEVTGRLGGCEGAGPGLWLPHRPAPHSDRTPHGPQLVVCGRV